MDQRGRTAFLSIITIVGAFALIAQFYTAVDNRIVSIAETLTRFFGFFTIESNIMITVCAGILWLKPSSGWGRFFGRATTQSALTVYIIIVGLIYNIVLRKLYHPAGLARVTDEMLHVALPLLFVAYWLIYTAKTTLTWNIVSWLIFPIVYAVVVLIRGAIVHYYPYPFLDAGKSGYPAVMFNIFLLVIAFVVLSLLLVVIGKFKAKRKTTP